MVRDGTSLRSVDFIQPEHLTGAGRAAKVPANSPPASRSPASPAGSPPASLPTVRSPANLPASPPTVRSTASPHARPMYHVICREIKDLMVIGLGRGKSTKEVAKDYCCSERTVRRVRLNWRRYGDVAPPRRRPTGRPRIFNRQAVQHLLGVLDARPDSFLDELQPALAAFARRDGRLQPPSLMTISRMLEREGITTKALSKKARERSR
jgi:transposase